MATPATLRVPLPRREQERLQRIALRFGLSLPDLSRRILQEIAGDMEEESLTAYRRPKALHASLQRAMRDLQRGRVSQTL